MVMDILSNMKKTFNILGVYRVVYFFMALFTMLILIEVYIHSSGDGSIGGVVMLGFPLYIITIIVILYNIVVVYFISKTSAKKKMVVGIYLLFLFFLLSIFPLFVIPTVQV